MERKLPFLLWATKSEVDSLLYQLTTNKISSEQIEMINSIKDVQLKLFLKSILKQNDTYSQFFMNLQFESMKKE